MLYFDSSLFLSSPNHPNELFLETTLPYLGIFACQLHPYHHHGSLHVYTVKAQPLVFIAVGDNKRPAPENLESRLGVPNSAWCAFECRKCKPGSCCRQPTFHLCRQANRKSWSVAKRRLDQPRKEA